MIEKDQKERKTEINIETPDRILVVEDNEGLSHLIQKNLQRAGFQTRSALNGTEAIGYLTDNQTTLLLLDYSLPDMSGKEVIKTLAEQNYHVPFIIMTGQGNEKIAVEMMKLGARDYLVKDSEFLGVLPSVVNKVLGQLEIEKRLNKTEEKLKKSEERYHNLVEFANVGIIAMESGKIIQVNRRIEEVYGYSKEELIGQSPDILIPVKYREQRKELLENILCIEKDKMVFEEEGIKKDGSLFPIEVSFSLSQADEHTVITVIRNITERKEMERKLIQTEKLKSLGELAGGVAHDFNNLLAAILGRVQLLRMNFSELQGMQERRKAMQDFERGLKIIEEAALDGAETVRRIQEFSRRRADDQAFTPVNINELIDQALEFTRMRWKNDSEAKGIKIYIKKDFSPLPSTMGCASELREIFTNLINNALDAMPQGGKIKIKTFKEDSHIAIEIGDTGVGIPRTLMDKIFDPFFTTKGPQSSGLGMSVSYGIINRHRGAITVESVEGGGTTFFIKFPLFDKKLREQEKKAEPVREEKRKATILIIEDEKDVREILYDILTDGGHQVATASEGREGVELFKRKEFDMVFTDLGMPGMSGWQVTEKIKSINRRIPVAFITGWNLELKESELRENGVDFIVYKPFEVKQVLRLVKEGMALRDRFKVA